MTRAEFLEALRRELADFPADDREDALKFYEEYLSEAGPENEAAVLAELGSPQKVARIIRANVPAGAGAASGARAARGSFDWRAPAAPDVTAGGEEPNAADDSPAPAYARPAPGAYEYEYDGGNNGGGGGGNGGGGMDRTLWIILLIVTFPIWIGLIGTAFGLAAGLVGTLCGIVGVGVGTVVAGVAALGTGVGLLFHSVGSGVLMIGLSLICIAIGAAIASLTVWAVAKFAPAAFRAVGSFCRKIFGKRRHEA